MTCSQWCIEKEQFFPLQEMASSVLRPALYIGDAHPASCQWSSLGAGELLRLLTDGNLCPLGPQPAGKNYPMIKFLSSVKFLQRMKHLLI